MSVALIVVIMAVVTAACLGVTLTLGARHGRRLEDAQRSLMHSAGHLDAGMANLLSSMDRLARRQDELAERLRNIEAIVTSEVWDRLQAGDEPARLRLLMKDEAEIEPDDAEKIRRLAQGIR